MNRKILAIFKLDRNTPSGTLLLESGTDITKFRINIQNIEIKREHFFNFFSVISQENLTCKSQRVTRECRFTLKLVRDMIITHSQIEVI